VIEIGMFSILPQNAQSAYPTYQKWPKSRERDVLKGESILYFGQNSFWKQKQRDHHLALGLTENNRVLLVEPGILLLKCLTTVRNQFLAPLGQIKTVKSKGMTSNLSVLTLPPVFLLGSKKFRMVSKINGVLLERLLRIWLRKLEFRPSIAWCTYPLQVNVLTRLPNMGLSCYDCMDSWSDFHGDIGRKQNLELAERQLLKQVDIVFASSVELQKKCSQWNSNVHLVPNGVDFAHFSSQVPTTLNCGPLSSQGFRRPILGFIGTIGEWVDLELLRDVALRYPKWTIVMIGPLYPGMSTIQCREIDNIHFLGPRHYNDVPAYLHEFDVSLLPFKITNLTRAVSPVKFYEYLATGKPIVATNLPEIEPYEDLCYVAANPDEFFASIDLALEEYKDVNKYRELSTKRQAVARQNTWETRVKTVSRIIGENMHKAPDGS
jgi:glycosyltransferase involved in cell wall biosynthesis